jgi:homoserine O-acetyltransferase
MTTELLTRKRRFDLKELKTCGGADIRDVAVGYETYGKLNSACSNAILVPHYFSGTSHAAGRYRAEDPQPGYWDAIIGPGKAVDTDRYFFISIDSLVNLNARDENVVTTGPASLDPATGKPYGLSFPPVAIGDFVRVQKALLESLGVSKLHAVMGPSMGGLQTYEWAATYPECVGRIIPVIATPHVGGWLTAWLSLWAQPIKLDSDWKQGAYDPAAPPLAGLEASLRLITLHALHSQWADEGPGRALAPGGDAGDIASDPYAIEQALAARARERAKKADANHLLYLARANQSFIPGQGAGAKTLEEGFARIKAPTLMLYAPQDNVFLREWVEKSVAALRKNGVTVETGKIFGPYGHYNGIMRIADCAGRIAEFLAMEF